MGYLLIDHSQTQGPDGKQGRKVETDTVACRHCRAVIRVLMSGLNRELESQYRCSRCDGPICKWCAAELERTKKCRPALAMIDEYLEKPRARGRRGL